MYIIFFHSKIKKIPFRRQQSNIVLGADFCAVSFRLSHPDVICVVCIYTCNIDNCRQWTMNYEIVHVSTDFTASTTYKY